MDNAINHSRFILTPEALTDNGSTNIPCDLVQGETLHSFLSRHVENIDSGAWTVAIGGREVPQNLWKKIKPKEGQTITCRCLVQKQVLRIVAISVLSYFTFGLGGLGAGGIFTAAGIGGGVIAAAGVYVAGSMIINKVLGPKPIKPSERVDNDDRSTTYSLTGQTNSARQYAPVGAVFGEVDVAPDNLSNAYTWYEAQEQFIGMNLCAGINVHSVSNVRLGTDPLSNYGDARIAFTGIPGMPDDTPLVYTNVQATGGGELNDEGDYITRTTSDNVNRLQLDIEYVAFRQNLSSGAFEPQSVGIHVEYKPSSSDVWIGAGVKTLTSSTSKTQRYTWAIDVPVDKYDVRVKRTDGATGATHITRTASLFSVKGYRPDPTNYRRWGQITLAIRATGQISGSVPTLFATFKGRPIPVWNGSDWVLASDRATGLSNPGAILLQIARGIYDYTGKLQFGFGLEDEYIDIEGLKAFMLHCTAHGFFYDKWVTDSVSLEDLCAEIALAGMGEFAWKDGASPSVRFASSNQPKSTEVNMANMGNASFEATYTLAQSADGVEYSFLNRDKAWASDTIRVLAPGVTEAVNPVRLTGAGITTAEHAAKLARFHLAQSLYQYKDVKFDMDVEHLDFRRLAIVGVSHDLTRWGHGGRLRSIKQVTGGFEVELDTVVTPTAQNYIGLRVPGERSYRVFPVETFVGETTKIKFLGTWPVELDFPGSGPDNPVFDTLWCLDFKPSPGLRMRVTSITPTDNLKGATIACVPEPDELWNYVYNGVYEEAPNSAYPIPHATAAVHSVRVSDHVNLQGDTEWYELQVLWETSGDYGYAQVWAAPMGSELALVSPLSLNSAVFRIESAGEWRIQIRPFTPDGRTGIATTVQYATDRVARPPRVPDVFTLTEVANGMRRYFWGWNGTPPINLRGVRIRYTTGFKAPEELDWGTMTPLGGEDVIFPAYFEHSLPDVGPWTFAIKSVNASGINSEGFRTLQKNLTVSPEDEYVIDDTPPPTPTGLTVSAAFSSAIVETDAPTYTEGHGHASTVVYVAEKASNAVPTYNDAKLLASFEGNIGAIPVELGKTYLVWAKWKSNDGYESEVPAGPVTLTVGKIGNADLGDLIIEAKNLADNAVTGGKLAAGAVDRTKFANGIEPVTNVTGSVLPTVKSTTTITFQGKLYRWDGTKYTVEVDTVDLVGTISKEQLAAGAVDATKFASGIEPVTNVAGTVVPTTKSTTVITVNGKLYRWNGTKYTAEVATVDLTGQIDSSKLADNAVTVGKIAAGAVEAGKLAKDAVTSEKLAAGAVDATKFASGIEPVTIVSGSTLPTTKSTSTIIFQGKLYRWNVTKYTAEVATVDLTGQIDSSKLADNAVTVGKIAAGAVEAGKLAKDAVTSEKLAAGAVDATKFASGIEPVTNVAGTAVPTTKSTTVITVNGKLYRWNGTKYTAEVATVDLTGQIDSSKLADNAVTVGKIAAGAVEAGKLAKDAVTSEKLAAGAVDATKFASGIEPVTIVSGSTLPTTKSTSTIVFQGKLYRWNNTKYTAEVATVDLTGQIDSSKLADNAVTVGKIAAGAVEAGKLAKDAVTSEKLAAGAVDATKFASGIEPVTIVSGSTLPTTKSTSTIVFQGKLYRWNVTKYTAEVATVDLTGQIDSSKLADNAVTVGKIAAGAVEAGKLAKDAVTSEKLAAGAVDATKFASGIEPVTNVSGSVLPTTKSTSTIVFQGKLYRWNGTKYTAEVATVDLTGTITTSQIAAGAVDSTKFASSIEPVTLVTGASLPTTKSTTVINWNNKLYRWDGTKYTAEVVVGDITGQITATQIADNAITTPKLATNAVDANKIAANAVTAVKIAADAITAGKIAAGAVNTRELAANSVTANKLVVTSTDTVNVDPFFQDADMWANANFTRKVVEGAPGPNVLAASVATSMQAPASYMTPIDTSKTYLFETWFIATAAQTNRAFASVRFYDANGVLLTGADAPNAGAGWPGTNASQGNYYFPSVGAAPTPTTWTRTTLTVGLEGAAKFPPKAAFFTAGAYLNYGSVAPIVESQWGGFRVTEMSRGELIVDGAVTAGKVAANAITANSIAAGAVTAGKIAANAVTANEIAANAVTTAKIKAGAVTATEIAARAITAEKLVIGSNVNLFSEPTFDNGGVGWYNYASTSQVQIVSVTGPTGAAVNALRFTPAGADQALSNGDWPATSNPKTMRSVQPGTVFKYTVTWRVVSGTTGKLRIRHLEMYEGSANSWQEVVALDATGSTAGAWVTSTGTRAVGSDRTHLGVQLNAVNAVGSVFEVASVVMEEMATGELIVDGAITAGKLAANSVTAASIAAGTITATELAANSVTTAKIAAGAVTANELAANSVTAVKIAAGSISADKIATNAITSDKVSANAITTAKIAAGAVTATEIAAKAITASKLVVGDSTNLVEDPEFNDSAAWVGSNAFTFEAGEAADDVGRCATHTAAPLTGTPGNYRGEFTPPRVKVEAGRQVYIKFRIRNYAASRGTVRLSAVYNSSSGASKSYNPQKAVQLGTDEYTVLEDVFTVPSDAIDFAPRLRLEYSSSGEFKGLFKVLDVVARVMASGELIVDGAVTADKIAAKTITAAQLAAGTITATELAANSVTTAKIAAGAVTANELAANSVTAVKIAANSVTTDKIAANAVTANEIAANAITSDKISANAITSAKIAAGAVTATEIAAKAITADKLVIGSSANMLAEGDFGQSGAGWAAPVGGTVVYTSVTDGPGGVTSNVQRMTATSTNSYTYNKDWPSGTPVPAGTVVRLKYTARKVSGTTGLARVEFIATGPGKTGLYRQPAGSLNLATAAVGVWSDFSGVYTLEEGYTAIGIRTQITANGAVVEFSDVKVVTMATGELIVDGAITAGKLAANSVTAASIAAGTVTATELAANSVTTAKIAAGAVTANELAANSVTAVKIAAGSISADKIAANAITSDKISANAITSAKIAAGAVTTAELAAGAVTASKMVITDPSTMVPDADYSDISMWLGGKGGTISIVTTSNREYNTLDNRALQLNRVQTGTDWDSAISSKFSLRENTDYRIRTTVYVPAACRFKVRLCTYDSANAEGAYKDIDVVATGAGWHSVEDTFTSPGNAAGARTFVYIHETSAAAYLRIGKFYVQERTTASLIVDGAVTADKIAAKTITAAQLAAGTISAEELAANSVTTAKIAAGAVTANELATNSVTAVKIAAGSISADKIASNAITSDKISANAITSAKIAAGAVTATEIAARAITADKLVVTSSGTVNRDPFFEDETLWDSRLVRKVVDGSPGPYVMASSVSMNGTLDSSLSPIDATKTYLFETWYKAQAATTNRAFAIVRFYDKDKNALLVTAPGWPGGNSPSGNHYFPNISTVTPQTWTKYSVTVGPEGTAKIPEGAVYFALGTYLNYNGVAPVVETLWGGIRVTEMASGELIVDGAVTADKIAAKTITAAQLAAGTITATELAVGSVTAGKIAAGSITATELATDSVTAVKIAANSVTTAKIAANAVTANEIAANSITTAKIAAGAVSANELAAGSVLASKLVVSDTSTLVPDAEYQDITMWRGASGGTVSFRLNETNALAGTVSKSVLQVNRLNSAGSGAWDGALSSDFAVTSGSDYVLRTNIYSPYASVIKVRVEFLTPSGASRSVDVDYTRASGGWFSAEVTGKAASTESIARASVYIREDSATAFIYVGKLRFNEAASGSLIVDGAISSSKIATNAIIADKISANSVTTAKIAANAVTANEIAANAITTAKIAAGAVNADQIAANAITVKHLTVMDYSNIVLDPYMQDASSWVSFTGSRPTSGFPSGMPGPACVQLSKSTAQQVITRNFQTSPGEVYYLSAYVASPTTTGLSIRIMLQFVSSGSEGGNDGTHLSWGVAVTVLSSAVAANQWVKIEGTVKVPAGAMFARARIVSESGTAAAGNWFVTNFVCRRAASSELIVDGSITADKIAVNAIAVGTAAIQNGAIVNAMIANATIDNAKIANLSAAKLTAGSMQVGSYIQSSTYTAGSAGWRIHANGSAEFSNVTVRGNIYSTQGSIGGININSNGLNAGAYTGYAWPAGSGTGFHLGPNGLLLGNVRTNQYVEIKQNGEIRAPGLTIAGGNATFSGHINGASGTFSGTLTANNVVTTENLKANSVTVPLFVESAPGMFLPVTQLGVPAFGPDEQCVINAGCSFTVLGNAVQQYLRVTVDGNQVMNLAVQTPEPNLGGGSSSSGSYVVRIVGNAQGRAVHASVVPGGTNIRGHVYVQATIFKR